MSSGNVTLIKKTLRAYFYIIFQGLQGFGCNALSGLVFQILLRLGRSFKG